MTRKTVVLPSVTGSKGSVIPDDALELSFDLSAAIEAKGTISRNVNESSKTVIGFLRPLIKNIDVDQYDKVSLVVGRFSNTAVLACKSTGENFIVRLPRINVFIDEKQVAVRGLK